MKEAYKRVVANKGSHGVDGMEVDELLPYLKENWPCERTLNKIIILLLLDFIL
ncbi:retron-type reverse transcriptase [Thermoanaerobacterium thermosulfurigenes]